VAAASSGPYATLHLTPDRLPCQHPTAQFFTSRLPFLPPNQQRQGTLKPNIENYMSLLKMVAYFFLEKLQIAQVFRRLNVLCVTRPAVIWCQKVKSIGFCFFYKTLVFFLQYSSEKRHRCMQSRKTVC